MVNLKLRIQIVQLMAKFDSPKQVFRALNSKNNNNSAKTPTESCIRKIYKKFCQTGSVLDKLKGSKVKKLEETKKNEITDILAANPKSSLTAISQSVDISRTTIWRFIKYQLHCKSYIIQTHQELYEEDFDRRLEMAEIVLPMLESRELAGLIFFSDEATFTLVATFVRTTVEYGALRNQMRSTHLKETVRK